MHSPVEGIVIEKMAVQGMKVMPDRTPLTSQEPTRARSGLAHLNTLGWEVVHGELYPDPKHGLKQGLDTDMCPIVLLDVKETVPVVE